MTGIVTEPMYEIRLTHSDLRRAGFELSGELDLSAVDELRAALEGQLRQGRRLLRADLHGVTFLDSAVLALFLDMHRRTLAVRGTLILTGLQPGAERLIMLAGLDRVLLYTTAESVRAAPTTASW